MLQTSTIAWGSPSRYIQGPGEIHRLPEHTQKYGTRIFAVIDQFFYADYTLLLKNIYEKMHVCFESFEYHTEITKKRIDQASNTAHKFKPDAIVGIGGGKALDTAKAVASKLNCPLVIAPTSASTDAPTSAMSIIYNDQHEHEDVYYYIKSPDMVLVDSEIIAKAPVRFLVAGMGDALATVFEARASVKSNSPNYICSESGNYRRSRTGIAIAEASYQILLENGLNAKIANENHIVTEALEAVIEANTLMSGLGFENVGCAASHVICNGLTAAPGGELALHGEKVAFGVLCQLLSENSPMSLVNEVMDFNLSVGLPLTLSDLGIKETEENYNIISKDTLNTEWTREPFYMNDAMVKAIIKQTNALGKIFKKQKKYNQFL